MTCASCSSRVQRHLNKVDGIRGTQTHIAFRAYSKHDLEATFSLGFDG